MSLSVPRIDGWYLGHATQLALGRKTRISFLCCGRAQSGGLRLLAHVVHSRVADQGLRRNPRVARGGVSIELHPGDGGNGTICRKET
jgi:hypothetical protein